MICIFAKEPGRAKRRLVPLVGADGATALARAFLEDTLALVPAPPHVWADGVLDVPRHALQQGNDLGERLLHTLACELDAGAPFVFVLGSDSPTLPRAIVEQALAALSSGAHDLVLGPASDGGYYAIGVTAAGARSDLFVGAPWSSPDVFAWTLARAQAQELRAFLLPPWYDVDTPDDLRHLERHLQELPAAIAPATRRCLANLRDRTV